jgi:hypothetical protein
VLFQGRFAKDKSRRDTDEWLVFNRSRTIPIPARVALPASLAILSTLCRIDFIISQHSIIIS